MKTITKISILTFPIVAFLVLLVVIVNFTEGSKEPTIEFKANNIYDETIIVAADKDFAPYSYFDENGNPTGHDIEMIYLIADAIGVNVEIRLMEWSEAIKDTKNKEVDVLLGLIYTPREKRQFQLSIPTGNDSFVVFGKKEHTDLNEFYEKKLAVLKSSDIIELFIEPYQLEQNTTEYNTYAEAFESVEKGENEYVICTYSVGRRYSAQYKSIDPIGPALVSNAFCMAVADGNTDLRDKINKTIVEKKGDETLYNLSEKWLGKYIEIISIQEFFKQHTVLFIVLLSCMFFTPLLSLIYGYKKRLIILKNNEFNLLERASRDYLTNLFNRSVAESMINQIISDAKSKGENALFMIDIDDFKNINDTYGHIFGDDVLVMVAESIKNSVRECDIVVRMGGDEFLIFMRDIKSIHILKDRANRVCTDLNKFITIDNIKIKTSVSIGISICPNDGDEFEILYQNADKALYQSKEKGKNQFTIYNND